MSIVKITTAAVAGSLFAEKADKEISVSKTEKQPVTMTGYIGANEVKVGEDGYKPASFGRLPVEGAKASDGRIVLQVAGGLRGVLFPAKTAGDNIPDYSGTLETGKEGEVFPIFARKRTGKSGAFLSINSGAPEMKKKVPESAAAESAAAAPSFADDDIPF